MSTYSFKLPLAGSWDARSGSWAVRSGSLWILGCQECTLGSQDWTLGCQEWILGEWPGHQLGNTQDSHSNFLQNSKGPRDGLHTVETHRFRTISGLQGSSRSQGCQEWVLECQEWKLGYQCLPAVTSCPMKHASACQKILQYNLSTCLLLQLWQEVSNEYSSAFSSMHMFSGACQCLPAAFTWTRFPFSC